MNLKEALNEAINILKKCDVESPAAEAGILLCFAIEKDKVFIYSHGEFVLEDSQLVLFRKLLSERVKGAPLQYLTGRQEFMSLMFKVAPGVLVPRQDTEILVEAVIELSKQMDRDNISILDLCTGSGCIAVSLAHYVENSKLTASDISPEALELAEYNAKSLGMGAKVRFIQSDLFQGFTNAPNVTEKFDIIVSNPPYIPNSHISSLQKEVRAYEPALALDGGEDGLDFYRKIIKEAPAFLNPGGKLAFEIGIYQREAVVMLMQEGCFHNLKVIKDLAEIERVIIGSLA